MPFMVARPTHTVSALPGVFDQALDMIEAALNSADFADLFFDLCGAFAVALQFQWTEADASDQWMTWTKAHPVPPEWRAITIDGAGLRNKFLRFLKYMYRDEPYRKRRRKNTPNKIGRLSANKGDCGYQLEQLLSNNMRFSYQ